MIAWVPKSSLPLPSNNARHSSLEFGKSEIKLANGQGRLNTVTCSGAVRQISVSNDGALAIAFFPSHEHPARLAFAETIGQATELNLVDLRVDINVAESEKVSLSSHGNMLAVGSNGQFVVVDVLKPEIALAHNGRSPSISPDGQKVAFVDDAGKLAIYSFVDHSIRSPLSLITDGVGSWSPDGRYLLAGVRKVSFLQRTLVIVDPIDGDFVDVKKIGDQRGTRVAWISKRFLEKSGKNPGQ
jgi:Tol biopolymer transport system component